MLEMTFQSTIPQTHDNQDAWIISELHQHHQRQQSIGTRLRDSFQAESLVIYRQDRYKRLIMLHDGSIESLDDGISQLLSLSENTATSSSRLSHSDSIDDIFLNGNSIGHTSTNPANTQHCLAARISIKNTRYFVVLYRKASDLSFDSTNVQMLQGLLPAFRRTFEAYEETLTSEEQLRQLGLDANLRDVDYIVDRKALILWASLRKQNASVLWPRALHDGTRLESMDAYIQSRLISLVERATQSHTPEGGIIITEQARIVIAPIESKTQGAYAAISIRDFHRTLSETCSLARNLYDLTPAETALCRSLLLGRSSQEHADFANVKVSTVRSHLKSLLTKTETVRQGQLISLLFRLSSGSQTHYG